MRALLALCHLPQAHVMCMHMHCSAWAASYSYSLEEQAASAKAPVLQCDNSSLHLGPLEQLTLVENI